MLEYTAKPANILFYYGWVNSFNSATNQWNNEKVAQELAKYNIVVFGDGVQDPSHGDFANTQVILPRIKALRPEIKIFGYVTINQDLNIFQTKASQWNSLSIDGIFLDEAGYDYGKNRSEFNERVNYVHSLSSANIAFANSWNIDHVLGVVNDPSYPNSTYNSAEVQSLLRKGDYYLLESFSVNTEAHSGNNGYATRTDWESRGEKAASYRNIYDVKMAAVNVINNSNTQGQTLFDFAYLSAMIYALDVFGSSDTSYGSTSSATTMWVRGTKTLGTHTGVPSIKQDASDANIYIHYGKFSKLSINWNGTPSASITTW